MLQWEKKENTEKARRAQTDTTQTLSGAADGQ